MAQKRPTECCGVWEPLQCHFFSKIPIHVVGNLLAATRDAIPGCVYAGVPLFLKRVFLS